MGKRFGVAFDNSELAVKAIELCLSLCREGDEVHVLRVLEPVRTDPPFGYSLDAAQRIIEERKVVAMQDFEIVERMLNDSVVSTWKVYVEVGDPRTTLVEFVRRLDIDLLFMGSRGLSGITGFFMGSSSQYALHHCPCPITIVK